MGIERVNGVTSVGVSSIGSATRVSSHSNTDVNVTEVASTTRAQQIENITVNASNNNSQGGAQGNQYGAEDKAALQGGKEVPKEKILSAVEDLNKHVKQNSSVKNTHLSFKYHDETNRISITVTDSDTDEVIREIPPEKALDMLAKAWEMAGLLVDEKR